MAKSGDSPSHDAKMHLLEAQLLQHHGMFLAFARKRLADPDLAADAVQDSLLKALKNIDRLRDNESVLPWFFRILRRTILDLYRRHGMRHRLLMERPEDFDAAVSEEEKRSICGCLRALLPTMRPEYAQAIEAVDLSEGSLETVAKTLGIAHNNLKVRLHRARKQLRDRLLQTCQICAKHGCLDCHCQPREKHT